jgi:hypothetical protein
MILMPGLEAVRLPNKFHLRLAVRAGHPLERQHVLRMAEPCAKIFRRHEKLVAET